MKEQLSKIFISFISLTIGILLTIIIEVYFGQPIRNYLKPDKIVQISGVITDAKTHIPLGDILVRINNNSETITDSLGHYKLKLNTSIYKTTTIYIKSLSNEYEEETIPIKSPSGDKEFNFRLGSSK